MKTESGINELAKDIASEQLVVKALEVLTINDGDVVIIKVSESGLSTGANSRIADAIIAFCARRGFKMVSVICIPQDCDIRSLHPNAMKQLGWERRPSLVIAPSIPGNGNHRS